MSSQKKTTVLSKPVKQTRPAHPVTNKGPFKFDKRYVSEECYPIQLKGSEACDTCRISEHCPFPRLKRSKVNKFGFEVPVTKYMGVNKNRKKLVNKK